MKQKRENETLDEYDRRIQLKGVIRAKDNKSKLRRAKNLAYLTNWKKAKYESETIQEKRKRINDKIDQKNWKDQYIR